MITMEMKAHHLKASKIIVGSSLDAILPTVVLTARGRSSVAGTITVSPNAVDDVGVINVRYHLDGSKLGAEDTTNNHLQESQANILIRKSYLLWRERKCELGLFFTNSNQHCEKSGVICKGKMKICLNSNLH